jgi:hypothetical protein
MASPTRLPEEQSSVVLLWAGEDPALLAALKEQLESAGIQYRETALGEDQVAPTADPLPIDFKPRFGFEVSVRSDDLPVAQVMLEKLLDQEPADMEIPAQDEVAVPPVDGNTSANPTLEIWTGAGERARFLMAALQENGIAATLEAAGQSSRVLVAEPDAMQAREIVREIVEGAPPK